MLCDVCALSVYKLLVNAICARVFFKALNSACFLKQFSLVTPLQNLSKWAIWVWLRICQNSALRAVSEPWFAAKCCPMFAFYAHTNYKLGPFAPGCVSSAWIRPTLWSSFPRSPVWKVSENERLRRPRGICHNSAVRAVLELRFAARSCLIFSLLVHTNCKLNSFVPGFF